MSCGERWIQSPARPPLDCVSDNDSARMRFALRHALRLDNALLLLRAVWLGQGLQFRISSVATAMAMGSFWFDDQIRLVGRDRAAGVDPAP